MQIFTKHKSHLRTSTWLSLFSKFIIGVFFLNVGQNKAPCWGQQSWRKDLLLRSYTCKETSLTMSTISIILHWHQSVNGKLMVILRGRPSGMMHCQNSLEDSFHARGFSQSSVRAVCARTLASKSWKETRLVFSLSRELLLSAIWFVSKKWWMITWDINRG